MVNSVDVEPFATSQLPVVFVLITLILTFVTVPATVASVVNDVLQNPTVDDGVALIVIVPNE